MRSETARVAVAFFIGGLSALYAADLIRRPSRCPRCNLRHSGRSSQPCAECSGAR